MSNTIRTSETMATIASHSLAGREREAFIEMMVNLLMCPTDEDYRKELVRSLAASVLSNRRA